MKIESERERVRVKECDKGERDRYKGGMERQAVAKTDKGIECKERRKEKGRENPDIHRGREKRKIKAYYTNPSGAFPSSPCLKTSVSSVTFCPMLYV